MPDERKSEDPKPTEPEPERARVIVAYRGASEVLVLSDGTWLLPHQQTEVDREAAELAMRAGHAVELLVE